MAKLKLQDVATVLKLSVSTVSKALHDSHEISEATKKRVLDYAKANHYFPNRMAKSLKMGKSDSIGVIICSISNNFVTQILDGIDLVCSKAGYDLIIMQSKESLVKEAACVSQLEARGVEGMLVLPSVETKNFERLTSLQRSGIPVVLFDRLTDQMEVDQVGADNFGGAYQATKHLIKNGHRRIAILNLDPSLNIASERLAGYLHALKEYGIILPNYFIQPCNCSTSKTIASDVNTALTKLVKSSEPPSAIVTASDQLSMQVLISLREMGLRVPEDFAIAAFSNTNIAEILATPLTAIHQPAFEIGETAARKLLQLLKQKQRGIPHEKFERVELPMQLSVRQSCMRKRNSL